jgi:hypothetical protein
MLQGYTEQAPLERKLRNETDADALQMFKRTAQNSEILHTPILKHAVFVLTVVGAICKLDLQCTAFQIR